MLMAQDEIMDILKANPEKWFSPSDILESVKINRNTVTTNFKRMRKHKIVDFELRKVKSHHVYFHKWNQKNGKRHKH